MGFHATFVIQTAKMNGGAGVLRRRREGDDWLERSLRCRGKWTGYFSFGGCVPSRLIRHQAGLSSSRRLQRLPMRSSSRVRGTWGTYTEIEVARITPAGDT